MSTAPIRDHLADERIPLLSGEGLSDEQRRVYEEIVSGPRGMMVGPLRAALHSPELASRWQKLGEHLRYETSLSTRQSELAIIAVARFWNSPVEWFIHAEIARREGVEPDVIEAIRTATPPTFRSAEDALVYDFTREMLEQGQVSDEVYGALYRRFDTVRMVELTALVGYYTMVAMTLNAHRVPLPPGDGCELPRPEGAGLQRTTRLPPPKAGAR